MMTHVKFWFGIFQKIRVSLNVKVLLRKYTIILTYSIFEESIWVIKSVTFLLVSGVSFHNIVVSLINCLKRAHKYAIDPCSLVRPNHVMVRSAGLCVCVCGIQIGIKHSSSCGINTAGFTMFYTNLNSTDADAQSRWTHHNTRKRRRVDSCG